MLTSYGLNIRKKLRFIERELQPAAPDDVVIEVQAAGLNPVDYKIIYGLALIIMRPRRPFALGFDLAGKIIAKGAVVNEFEIGDEVYAKVPWDQMGTIATEINVRSNMVAKKPRNLSFVEAAGIPLVGCTVLDAFAVAEVRQGSRLLIIGGSGGIGTFAIQYARYLGAYVYAVCSTANVELVRSLGADRVIDYKQEDFRALVKEVDVVFDAVGGRYPWKSLTVVKQGGKIISVAGHHDNETLREVGIAWIFRMLFLLKGSLLMLRMRRKGVLYKHVWSYPNQKKLKHLTSLIEGGKLKAVVDRVYAFQDAIEGLLYLCTNRAKGKVIVRIREPDTTTESPPS